MPRCTPLPRPWIRRISRKPAPWAAFTYSSTTDLISRGSKACRSSVPSIGTWCSMGIALLAGLVGRGDHRLDSAAHGEVADDGHAPGLASGDEVVEDLVGDRLVEDAAVSELDHVVLERLQLD